MKTPITDAIWDQTKGIPEYHAKLEEAARRLELDRAALMEAMEGLVSLVDYSYLDRGVGTATEAGIKRLKARAALAAARANFPES
jgi:hypothetical protein